MPTVLMGRHFRHTLRAAAFCAALLVGGFVLLFHTSAAKPDPIAGLLKLPAPPPPNPVMHPRASLNGQSHDRQKPPDDNAPIEDLLDYWTQESSAYNNLRFNAEPSQRTRDRLLSEIQNDPKLLANLLNVFNDDTKAADSIYEIYNREGTGGALDRDSRKTVRDWLTYHSSYYSQNLESTAAQAGDTDGYVSNQQELLALTHVDFDRARPIIDRLYSGPDQKVGRVLAQWALYRHALDTGSGMDADRYRKELQDVVEDRNAAPGARDLAIDAIAQNGDFPGRDEWYFSLLSDETLAELKVNGSVYTGLTTMMLVSPGDKYVPKMIELLKSNDPVVRGNAVKNLVTKIDEGGPDLVQALLPWLEDPKWAKETGDTRAAIVRKLADIQMPESVPGLINVLEEKRTVMVPKGVDPNSIVYSSNVAVANAMNAVANAANAAANAAASAARAMGDRNYNTAERTVAMVQGEQYPYRTAAIYALTKQKDSRAVPALKRTLYSIEPWERESVVKAIFVSGGFTLNEQLDALETAARGSGMEGDALFANKGYSGAEYANTLSPQNKPITPLSLRQMLGEVILQNNDVSDELARAVVARVEDYDKRDPAMSEAYRKIVLQWPNAVVNMLFLRDTKRDMANTDTLVRLLSQRKQLREKQSADASDLRTGSQRAIGIAACLFEDKNDYDTILDSGTVDAKTAVLACGRLIRAPLVVAKVVPLLTAKEPLLALAADKFLESEDSPAARVAVLARHQGEARIMGAMTSFKGAGESENDSGVDAGNYEVLAALFQSIGDPALYNGWSGTGGDPELAQTEERLQDEVKRDTSLVGIYAYDRNYIRIYQNKAVYSFEEDDSRYHERPLTHEEFENIKSYLSMTRADEMPPFLFCGGQYCTSKELLMIGRNGGRRVYVAGDNVGRDPDFFAGLNGYFDTLKKEPGTLKYALSRELPGLEIVYASDGYNVATVWGDASSVAFAAGEKAIRDKIKREVSAMDDPEDRDENADDGPAPGEMSPEAFAAYRKRRWEGYAWYTVGPNGSLNQAAQPTGVDLIPSQGNEQDSWKGRVGSVEVQSSNGQLLRVQAGRSVKVGAGDYSSIVITGDGRWLFAKKANAEDGTSLVRIDLTTRHEYPVVFENEYGQWAPAAVVPGTNAVIVQNQGYRENDPMEEDPVPDSIDPSAFKIIDAASGNELQFRGDARPFAQQTFRPLQRASKPGELWAAMPDSDKNATDVGTVDLRTFSFTPILHVPKIMFDSMKMWVDEAHQKVYFVYRGHLLSLPLGMTKEPIRPARH